MLGYVEYYKNGKVSPSAIKKVFVPKPEIIDIKIKTHEDLWDWRDEYEKNLYLQKDNMKVAVLVNNHLKDHEVKLLKKHNYTKEYYSHRLLHIYYYFCVSRFEVCVPEAKIEIKSNNVKDVLTYDEVYNVVRKNEDDTQICRCVKYDTLYKKYWDEFWSWLPFMDIVKGKEVYDAELINNLVWRLLPKIYKHYQVFDLDDENMEKYLEEWHDYYRNEHIWD